MYVYRELTKALKSAVNQFAAILVTGPRQSGKTTLVKQTFSNYVYVNLEDPVTLNRVREDPKSILKEAKIGIIIDEVQKYPELLSYIQIEIDQDYKPGRFILTGSQNILMAKNVSQSLAGRVAVFKLFPLTLKEYAEAFDVNLSKKSAVKLILDGFYPSVYARNLDRKTFYGSYLETYVERDVRTLRNIGNLDTFRKFLSLLAGRVGQLIDFSSLANDVGVSYKTIKEWISVLEASYIIFKLPPYFENFGKRVIKTPKVYFWDTGLLTYLLEIDSVKELKNYYAIGSIFENFIIADFYKRKHHLNLPLHFYFWRDKKGHEIDLFVTSAIDRHLIEIKYASTFVAGFLRNINYVMNAAKGSQFNFKGCLVYQGENLGGIRKTVIINWREIIKIQENLAG